MPWTPRRTNRWPFAWGLFGGLLVRLLVRLLVGLIAFAVAFFAYCGIEQWAVVLQL